jgi:hypothetical protein
VTTIDPDMKLDGFCLQEASVDTQNRPYVDT